MSPTHYVSSLHGSDVLQYSEFQSPSSPPPPVPSTEPKRKDVGLVVPSDGNKYVQIKHDWEVMGDSRAHMAGSKYGHPAVVNKSWGIVTTYNGREFVYESLRDSWHFFLDKLFKWSVDNLIPSGKIESFYQVRNNEGGYNTFAKTTPGSSTWYYVDMIQKSRAFTDSWSPETGAWDAVTARNPGAKPYEWLCRTTTGNILRVTSDMGTKWKVAALDILKEPPTMEYMEQHPEFLHWATEIGYQQWTDGSGRYSVSNFPQAEVVSLLNALPFRGTPIPMLSVGGSFLIDKKAVRELSPGQKYSPYMREIFD